ncbi:MAG: DoxX family protein [Nannocystis sp.]|jgi:apolipoprotein N-acyltransferase|nr:DoxX family protein [Nannocystis sp.]
MSNATKGRTIAYWVTTGLICAAMLGSGVMDLLAPPEMTEAMTNLGFPLHLLLLLGIAKLLAVAAILAPGLPRLKEWAYAGLFFDLAGAIWSHIHAGDGPDRYAVIFVFIALLFASHALRPSGRTLVAAG